MSPENSALRRNHASLGLDLAYSSNDAYGVMLCANQAVEQAGYLIEPQTDVMVDDFDLGKAKTNKP